MGDVEFIVEMYGEGEMSLDGGAIEVIQDAFHDVSYGYDVGCGISLPCKGYKSCGKRVSPPMQPIYKSKSKTEEIHT